MHHDEKRIVFVAQVHILQLLAILPHECDVLRRQRQRSSPPGNGEMRLFRKRWDGQDRPNQKLGIVLHVRCKASPETSIKKRVHQVQVEPLNVDDQIVQVGQISLCLAHDDIQRRAARRACAGRQTALTRRADGVPTSPVARRFVVANRTLARKGVPTVSAKMVGLRVGDLASTALAHLYLDIWRASLEKSIGKIRISSYVHHMVHLK